MAGEEVDKMEAPERLRRAETVLDNRTGRIVLVLEHCMDTLNHQSALRTAEALGIQHVWIINPNPEQVKTLKKKRRNGTKKITKNASFWLTIREFTSISDCITALRAEGCTIWATDLSPEAVPLIDEHKPTDLPDKLALVMGREIDGVSQEMLRAANKRVYLPIVGFTESLNLSVATALVLQRVLDWFPQARGDLSKDERESIRSQWYPQLVNNPTLAEQAEPWRDQADKIPRLGDLRRDKSNPWVSKRIRDKEQQLPEVQERTGGQVGADKDVHAL